jgi:hypothetical protein
VYGRSFGDIGEVIKMFCLYCVYYKDLESECQKGIKPTDLQKTMKCTDYQYNGEVKYE